MPTPLQLAAAPTPNFDAFVESADIERIVGALLTYGLLLAVLMVVVCAAGWALGSANGNWQAAGRAKAGVFVSLAGSVLLGGALAWTNWLLDLGATL